MCRCVGRIFEHCKVGLHFAWAGINPGIKSHSIVSLPIVCRAKPPAAVEALSVSFNMFTNERDYPTGSRRGIGERVCCTLLRMVFHGSLIEFYVHHIVQIMAIVEGKVLRVCYAEYMLVLREKFDAKMVCVFHVLQCRLCSY